VLLHQALPQVMSDHKQLHSTQPGSVTIEKLSIVSQLDKLLAKILLSTSDASIPFTQLCQLLCSLGLGSAIARIFHNK
jgi:hypothetical protein